MIQLTINKKARSLDIVPDILLIWVLRDIVNLTGNSQCVICNHCSVSTAYL